MLKKVVLSICSVLTIILIGLIVWGCYWNFTDYQSNKDYVYNRTYEGRLLLDDAEWEDVKYQLADNHDIRIEKMDAYSSDSHLIDFELKVPGDSVFPYGEVTNVNMAATLGFAILGFILIIAFGIAIIIGLWAGSVTFLREQAKGD